MEQKKHIINVENKSLGRVATRIAILLRGKNRPDFVPNKDMGDFVAIKNIDKIKITGKKMDQKMYYHHSGYLGGLKAIPLKKLLEKKPNEALRKAVFGMLPKNKLRAQQIKRLTFLSKNQPKTVASQSVKSPEKEVKKDN